MNLPRAREDELVVRELSDETLVYDQKRHRAYCLNRTAALVWRHCDGRTNVADMARRLEEELNLPAGEDAVWLALKQLGRSHLLRERVIPPVLAGPYTRRAVMKRMALVGAAVVIPVVVSISAPTVAQAQSCINVVCAPGGNGELCGGGAVPGQPCDPNRAVPCDCACKAHGANLKCNP